MEQLMQPDLSNLMNMGFHICWLDDNSATVYVHGEFVTKLYRQTKRSDWRVQSGDIAKHTYFKEFMEQQQ